jgi:3-oxoacyl-[acyl-carrier-protein] synthase-3
MSRIYVSQFGTALGSDRRTVEDAEANGLLVSTAAALRSAGFAVHHRCARDESAYELASRALVASGIDPATIDAIVYSTCLPQNGNLGDPAEFERSGDVKNLMRFPASELQADFDMHRAFVVGLGQQACTGMLGALRIGRSLLLAERELQNVLCVTADRFPPGAKYEQSFNLISDGAAACLLSRKPARLLLCGVHHISNGAMVRASDDETAASFFSYTCRLVDEALKRAALTLSDIRWIVPQNINSTAMKILGSLMGAEQAQIYHPSIANCGHVISADNIINLSALCSVVPLAAGDRLLTLMAGYGSNWQCALLEAT